MQKSTRTTHYTTDHDTIKHWAQERGGKPATIKGTRREAEHAGVLRIDFPGYSGDGILRKVPWKDFFDKFDKENLVFIYQEQTKNGQRSNFNKIVRMPKERSMAQAGKTRKGSSARSGRTSRASETGRREVTGRATTSTRSNQAGDAAGNRKAGGRTAGKRNTPARGVTSTGRGQTRTTRVSASKGKTAGRTAGTAGGPKNGTSAPVKGMRQLQPKGRARPNASIQQQSGAARGGGGGRAAASPASTTGMRGERRTRAGGGSAAMSAGRRSRSRGGTRAGATR